MNGWLLDTDVLSAFAPGRHTVPPDVAAWFDDRTDMLYLSTITAAEIEAGIAKLRRTGSAQRADARRRWFERVLALYADRVLPFDITAARVAGLLSDAAQAAGRHPGFADDAIAAIAKARELVVLTLNRRHFDPLGVGVLNPFDTGRAV
jgi:predicted nucleic acid-binding protein